MMMMITTESINDDIAFAERELQETERKLLELEFSSEEDNNTSVDNNYLHNDNNTPVQVSTSAPSTNPTAINRSSSSNTNKGKYDIKYNLERIQYQSYELLFLQQLVEWSKTYHSTIVRYSDDDTTNTGARAAGTAAVSNTTQKQNGIVLYVHENEIQCFESLGRIFIGNETTTTTSRIHTSELYQTVYNNEYTSYYEHLRCKLIASFRCILKQSNYPNPDGCFLLSKEFYDYESNNYNNYKTTILLRVDDDKNNDNDDNSINQSSTSSNYEFIVRYIQYMNRIRMVHKQVVRYVTGTTVPSGELDDIVLELCRPFVERVRYHFVIAFKNDNNSPISTVPDKANSTKSAVAPTPATSSTSTANTIVNHRIDRLPELLFTYVRTNILGRSKNNTNQTTTTATTSTTSTCTVWELINNHISVSCQKVYPTLGIDFMNEIVRMIQWVLIAEHNFFRHPIIAGTNSNPIYLYNAIEEILQLDWYIREQLIVPPASSSDTTTSSSSRNRIIRLFDVCVAGDEDLFRWWIRRESDNAVSVLLFDDSSNEQQQQQQLQQKQKQQRKEHTYNSSMIIVSSQSELCCSLLRSILLKASIFTFSGPYLSEVAVPLCMKYIDSIHKAVVTLKASLKKKQNNTRFDFVVAAAVTNSDVETYIYEWMELINGTHMVASIIPTSPSSASDHQVDDTYNNEIIVDSTNNNNYYHTKNEITFTTKSNQQQHMYRSGFTVLVGTSLTLGSLSNYGDDFYRLGKSLDSLQNVLMDDFVRSIMDVLLMERSKFASYLMRCSHYLTVDQTEDPDRTDDVSVDIQPAIVLMNVIMKLCESALALTNIIATDDNEMEMGNNESSENDTVSDIERWMIQISRYAPSILYERILSDVSRSLLVVALNLDGMTPYISVSGAKTFARDVTALFESTSSSFFSLYQKQSSAPSDMNRLFDIVKVMCMEPMQLIKIGRALCDLSGQAPPLEEHMFEADSRIFDEAISMIRVQGLQYIELSDVLSILNRRSDI